MPDKFPPINVANGGNNEEKGGNNFREALDMALEMHANYGSMSGPALEAARARVEALYNHVVLERDALRQLRDVYAAHQERDDAELAALREQVRVLTPLARAGLHTMDLADYPDAVLAVLLNFADTTAARRIVEGT